MTIPAAAIYTIGGAAASAVLAAWLGKEPDKPDPWENKDVFNARMRDMHGLALALNDGFARCPSFMANKAQLTAWRATRDNLGKFYGDVGTLVYLTPRAEQIEQAKEYAAKLYFWNSEYERLKCGGKIDKGGLIDDNPKPVASTDWVGVAKWSAIGLGVAIVGKTVADIFRTYR